MIERIKSARMIIAGGGTGGHLFPAIAVAEEFLRRSEQNEVLFVGTAAGLEARILPRMGYRLETIEVAGLKGKGLWKVLAGLKRIPGSIIKSRGIIKEFKPQVVLGVGGYASGPTVLAAHLMGIPTAIAEQNASPGMANAILGRFANRIFVSFEETKVWFPIRRVIHTGNPVRTGFLEEVEERSTEEKPFTLLIFGGSQGASGVNRAVAAALPYLEDLKGSMRIIHQTGSADLEWVKEEYAKRRMDVEVQPFIDDMARVFRIADLLVCRAGATTIAEITAMGKAAILIPYPHAAGDHQVLNAKALVKRGAAEMIEERDLTGESLAMHIRDLYHDPERLKSVAENSKKMGKPDASRVIVDRCMEIIRWEKVS